ncbi:MAG: HD domain-containing protein [Bacteroidota bacterium]
MMNTKPNHNIAIKMAQELLKVNLDSNFKFHSYGHTLNVVRSAHAIGFHSELNSKELAIVNLAAWFHDLGYCLSHENHEQLSAKLVRKILTPLGIDRQKISLICDLIMATRLPQTPKNLLEQVLCDADMSHLSQIDYPQSSLLLKSEIELIHGINYTDQEWNRKNIEFFNNHKYFTPFGKKILAPLKTENLKNLCAERLLVA